MFNIGDTNISDIECGIVLAQLKFLKKQHNSIELTSKSIKKYFPYCKYGSFIKIIDKLADMGFIKTLGKDKSLFIELIQ